MSNWLHSLAHKLGLNNPWDTFRETTVRDGYAYSRNCCNICGLISDEVKLGTEKEFLDFCSSVMGCPVVEKRQ